MRSLFLKIFFLFWLSNATVFFIAFAVFAWFVNEVPERHPRHNIIRALAVQAATIYERDGEVALRAYLAQLKKARGTRAFLLDAQGRPLAEPVPEPIASQIVRYPQWLPPHTHDAGHVAISAVEVHLTSGLPYRFIATHRPRPPWRRRFGPLYGRLGLFFMATALASGLIALLVTRPLRRLRTTTQQFAKGNLTVRTPATVRTRTDAIGELGREFDHMASRIETLVESQTRLLRDVSHDLRSPLARMQVAATLAEAHAGEAAAEDLERIQIEIERLNELIERLLTLTRLESGSSQLERHPVNLATLLGQIMADADYEHRGDGKHVHLMVTDPRLVLGDEAALHSAFENILRNALRYTEKHTEITVTLAAHPHEPSMLRIGIRDHGPGVPEAILSRLFEAFFRSDEARDQRTGSHGIGLAIARAVIERHGGQIRAHNHPAGGLCVTVELPT